MKKWERRAAAFFFVIAAVAAVMAYGTGFGSFGEPGAGFFPFWLAVLMAAAAGVYYWMSRDADDRPATVWGAGKLKRPLVAVGVMLVFSQAMEYLGFFAATFFLLAAWQAAVERKSWKMTGLVAVIGTLSVYVLFGYLLQLPLPQGLLF